ncbi:MAG: Septum formation initiator [Rickettsiales bacterium]|jgi:cell division protein FtsB|nr:Septum formation initiator [Rickettsiales bacterium]
MRIPNIRRIRRSLHRPLQHYALSGLFFLCCYFAYHVASGDRGLLALIRLQHEAEVAHAQLESLQAERIGLEHRVSLLRPSSLDLDLLDQQSRKYLGYVQSNEDVYYIDGQKVTTVQKTAPEVKPVAKPLRE